jgi:CBS domain-containing protein
MKHATLGEMVANMRVHTVAPNDTVRNACIAMSSANVGALPVVDQDGALIGMLSERDVIQRSIIVYRESKTTRVDKVMTPNPQWLPPEAKPLEAHQVMLAGRFRHLPVCANGRVTGIVSLRDFDVHSKSILAQLRDVSSKALAGR